MLKSTNWDRPIRWSSFLRAEILYPSSLTDNSHIFFFSLQSTESLPLNWQLPSQVQYVFLERAFYTRHLSFQKVVISLFWIPKVEPGGSRKGPKWLIASSLSNNRPESSILNPRIDNVFPGIYIHRPFEYYHAFRYCWCILECPPSRCCGYRRRCFRCLRCRAVARWL